jgi:putative copper resistance protein D
MKLLVDVFGYLTVLLNGGALIGQAIAIGSILFLVLLLRPLQMAAPFAVGARGIAWGGAALMLLCAGLVVAMQAAVLMSVIGVSAGSAFSAPATVASLVQIGAMMLIVLALMPRGTPGWVLLGLGAIELAAGTFTSHAAARLDDRVPLMLAEGVHQFGVAIWIGGIPAFLFALARARDGREAARIGARFSKLSLLGVGSILVSGVALAYVLVGSWAALYGTAYGTMLSAKIIMFGGLLSLGAANFLLIRRLTKNPDLSFNRLRRFAEVEIGVGLTVILTAASLTSAPPSVYLQNDMVSLHEIAQRYTPAWPLLTSPDHDSLTLPALQAKLDAEAKADQGKPPPAFVPGDGDIAARNASDIAWSEYNHHWAGIFVVLIGFFALLSQAGLRWARHWPVLFFGLAVFLFFRSDPETWPMGQISFWASMRDVEVLQHRFFVLLLVGFAFFEWRVRAGKWAGTKYALVFPILTAVGAAVLLTHSHAIANIRDAQLIELSHTPLALFGVTAGWARWLELRLNPPGSKIAGWVWPVFLMLAGLVLLDYREA